MLSRRDGWLDPAMLEVPHNSDATIRLLKARIKSLEEQLGTALKLNQGQSLVNNSIEPGCMLRYGPKPKVASPPHCPHACREGECSS